MKRSTMAGMVFAVALVAILGVQVRAVQPVYTIEWIDQVDNAGDWNDANAWRNLSTGATGDSTALMGENNSFEGQNNVDPTLTRARNIVIGGGDTVTFNIAAAGSTFRLRQGMTMTVEDGATWLQNATLGLPVPNDFGWFECRCDMSELMLDGGTFRREGTGTEEVSPGVFENVGGGNMLLGSYNDDNNTPRLGTLPPVVKVTLKNGGRIENEGQLWFGTDGESSPEQRVHMTINDGHLDLTGGQYIIDNGEMSSDSGGPGVAADLAFFYDWSESLNRSNPLTAHNEEHVINFTGPGSIKVDSTGIRVLEQPAPSDPTDPLTASSWTGAAVQVSYQDLWNRGILQANGLSGKVGTRWGDNVNTPHTLQPADFNNFFTVTGTPGTDDYTLTAKPATTLATVEWQGGSGEWHAANKWKNLTTNVTGDAVALLGSNRGTEGMNSVDPAVTAARHIVIGGGATVDYDQTVNGGLRLRKGSTLTIKDGATLVQDISDSPPGNGWDECRCDPSELILDGGTFRRTGEGTEEVSPGVFENVGGGNMLFGSYNDDNNTPRLGTLPPAVKVTLKNGGRIENTGQLWFGTDGESSPETRVSFTINDGHLDLTGGQYIIDNGEMSSDSGGPGVAADLAFFYDWSESLARSNPLTAHNEEYEINFTGPGSITVDATGIRVLTQPAPSDPTDPLTASSWTGAAVQVSYQDLWNLGILKANGLSGKTGTRWGDNVNTPHTLQPADFNDFFTVTGTPGTDNYILNSLIEALPDADYNEDGIIDAADWVAGRKLGLDLDLWEEQFGEASPAGAGGSGGGGVPEPGTMLLMVLGLASVALFKVRSR